MMELDGLWYWSQNRYDWLKTKETAKGENVDLFWKIKQDKVKATHIPLLGKKEQIPTQTFHHCIDLIN